MGEALRIAIFGGGAGSTGHSWRELLRRLDLTDLKVVAIDLRGHGESDQPETGFTLERFTHDILTVAYQAGAERFVIVGYSMSGRWSQWILCQFPERVLGQILIAPAPAIPLQLGNELLETRMRDTREREHFDAFVRQFTSASPPHLSVRKKAPAFWANEWPPSSTSLLGSIQGGSSTQRVKTG